MFFFSPAFLSLFFRQEAETLEWLLFAAREQPRGPERLSRIETSGPGLNPQQFAHLDAFGVGNPFLVTSHKSCPTYFRAPLLRLRFHAACAQHGA